MRKPKDFAIRCEEYDAEFLVTTNSEAEEMGFDEGDETPVLEFEAGLHLKRRGAAKLAKFLLRWSTWAKWKEKEIRKRDRNETLRIRGRRADVLSRLGK